MSKRRTHSPEFKVRFAMEAISGRKTIQEIAASSPDTDKGAIASIRKWLEEHGVTP